MQPPGESRKRPRNIDLLQIEQAKTRAASPARLHDLISLLGHRSCPRVPADERKEPPEKGHQYAMAPKPSCFPQILLRFRHCVQPLSLLGAYAFIAFHAIAAVNLDVSSKRLPSLSNWPRFVQESSSPPGWDLDSSLPTSACIDTGRRSPRQTGNSGVRGGNQKLTSPLFVATEERELYQRFTTNFARYLEIGDRAKTCWLPEKQAMR